jgi:multicomponent Na+:H+ antiporter subunit D
MQVESLPLVIVIVTFIGAFVMPFLAHWAPRFCHPLATTVIAATTVMSAYLSYVFFYGGFIKLSVGGWDPPVGIQIMGGPLASLLLLLISIIVLMVLLYARRAVEREFPADRIGWYYVILLLCAGGMMGLAVSNDLFNMYVLMEIIGLSACSLVAARSSKPALLASFKYLMLTTIGSGFLLFGIGLIYAVTGHLSVDFAVAGLLRAENVEHVTWVALTFIVVGITVKAGLFPLHFWLPDAHSTAPTTSSVILSGLVVKMYVVVIVRLLHPLHNAGFEQAMFLDRILPLIGAASMLFGSCAAMIQQDLKRMLAYSTVAQLGYIFVALGMKTQAGLIVAFFHIWTHAFMKSVLFLAAGNLAWKAGSRNIRDMAGLGRELPLTSTAFTIAAFSMIGFPLTGGFVTKYMLAMTGLDSGQPWILVLVVVSGLLNAIYYLPVTITLFFGGNKRHYTWDRVPLGRVAPICILAAGVVVLGLLPLAGYEFLARGVEVLLP